MKKITIIMVMIMMLMATACSPAEENKQPQTQVEVVETTSEAAETPTEIVETTAEVRLITTVIQGTEMYTEENLERGQELAVMVMENLFNYNEEMNPSQNLAVLEKHFHSKTAQGMTAFVENNATAESYVTPTMDYKESYIAITTIPAINDKEKMNAFAYTFTVNRVIDGEEQGIENISVLFVIEDGEFKVVGTFTEES